MAVIQWSAYLRPGADPGVEIGGHVGPYGEREPITGVCGLCRQRGPGAEPLVRVFLLLCPKSAQTEVKSVGLPSTTSGQGRRQIQ